MNLVKEINKYLDNKYDYLKLLKVVYNTTFSYCQISFIYPEDKSTLTTSQKQEIKDTCGKVININSKLEIKFNKSYLDNNIVIGKCLEFIRENYNSIASCFNEKNILFERDKFAISITISVNQTLADYINEDSFIEKLKLFLTNNFCGEFYITIKIDNLQEFNTDELEKRAELIQSTMQTSQKIARYKVEELIPVFGGEINPNPEYIKNIDSEKMSVILAGTVKDLIEKEFLPNSSKKKNIDEKRKMYTFKLCDDSKCINAIHFCTKTSEKHFKAITDGSHILCLGNVKKSKYGDMQYSINSIELCKKPENLENYIEPEENEIEINEYKYVKPVPYVRIKQDNLFESKKVYPEWIKEKNWVVFDVETTGLISDIDEITEIGAVKIVNGEIVEKFQTLCKTHSPIPLNITKLTGITDEMVADRPFSEELINDFLLFTKDCALVGYNVNFDYQFIQNSAKKVNLSFPNEIRDCLVDAREKIYLPNYKLGTLVSWLGITLDNAHRALYDATATAEAFLELSTREKK